MGGKTRPNRIQVLVGAADNNLLNRGSSLVEDLAIGLDDVPVLTCVGLDSENKLRNAIGGMLSLNASIFSKAPWAELQGAW